jgi:hypothetical protein
MDSVAEFVHGINVGIIVSCIRNIFGYSQYLRSRRRVISVVWDVTPRSTPKVCRNFEGTYRLHLQGRR